MKHLVELDVPKEIDIEELRYIIQDPSLQIRLLNKELYGIYLPFYPCLVFDVNTTNIANFIDIDKVKEEAIIRYSKSGINSISKYKTSCEYYKRYQIIVSNIYVDENNKLIIVFDKLPIELIDSIEKFQSAIIITSRFYKDGENNHLCRIIGVDICTTNTCYPIKELKNGEV